jgi:hypothetical protein
MDDNVAGEDFELDDAGQWSPTQTSVDDMDDTVAGQDIELDDASQLSPV